MVKKIRKKYDEWIVETEKRPMVKGAEVIPMKSLEDLVKISEELGKPVIYYKSPPDLEEKHTFYVLDETVHYEYVLTDNEKIKKTARCSKCNTKVSYEEYPWENIYVTCPNCGSKGIVAPKNITKTIKKVLDDKTKK